MNTLDSASRRDFLKRALSGAAVVSACGVRELLAAEPGETAAKSRVVVARDAQLRGTGSTVDSGRMLNLLDRAMQAQFDRDNPIEVWRKVVRSGQIVGIKVNTLGGRGVASNPQLVEAICERLQEAGIKAGDIVVWDRDSEEMEHGGFHLALGGNRVQCYGTDRVGYEQDLVEYGSVGSQLSKILTRHCNVLINVPVLKDHDGAGVTCALKNMYGVIHNPNKYHPNGCNPYIADLNMLPDIRSRMRLTICDATTIIYEGGPGYKPEHSSKHNALLVAQDPVALDSVGWQIIERKRAEMGLKTLESDDRAPRYIATAADREHRLGTNDPRKIAKIEL
ncbi:MAG: DUF362 domain-containing protein [Terracidiphilus sp.]|nr:DUF362 domain-containing protein [Terracidiphilus sp.]